MDDEEVEKITYYPVLKKLQEDSHFMCKQPFTVLSIIRGLHVHWSLTIKYPY